MKMWVALAVPCLAIGLVCSAFAQNPPTWQGTVNLSAPYGATTATATYTNSTAVGQLVTGVSFVNFVDSAADDGSQFTQLNLYTYRKVGSNYAGSGQVVLFPAPPPRTNRSGPGQTLNYSGLDFALNPGDRLTVVATRTFNGGTTSDPTVAHFTLTGPTFALSPASAPWQSILKLTTPTNIGTNSYVGQTTYTNPTQYDQIITNLEFVGQNTMKRARLYTMTQSNNAWTTTGEAVIYPVSGTVGASLNVSGLNLVLGPGDRLVILASSTSASAFGYLTFSGPTTALGSPWQALVNLSDPTKDNIVDLSVVYVNPSSTVAETITNITFVNLHEDTPGSDGEVFTQLHLYAEKLVGGIWEPTAQEVFYPTITASADADMILGGMTLTLMPHERLVIVGSRLGYGIVTQPTIGHLTLSGYTFTPS